MLSCSGFDGSGTVCLNLLPTAMNESLDIPRLSAVRAACLHIAHVEAECLATDTGHRLTFNAPQLHRLAIRICKDMLRDHQHSVCYMLHSSTLSIGACTCVCLTVYHFSPLQEGWNRLFMKGAETLVLPGLLLLGSVYWVGQAVAAGSGAWLDYLKLFDESRFVHATSIDFALFTALAPFWMSNDAEGRGWGPR